MFLITGKNLILYLLESKLVLRNIPGSIYIGIIIIPSAIGYASIVKISVDGTLSSTLMPVFFYSFFSNNQQVKIEYKRCQLDL